MERKSRGLSPGLPPGPCVIVGHMTTDATPESLVVPELYAGYPGVAFGGFVAGVLAERSGAGTVRVDFRGPVPVGVPVRLSESGSGGWELGEPGRPLAAAEPVPQPGQPLEAPPAPGWDEAVAAAAAFRAAPPEGLVDCFGCGLDRTPDRGLRQHCTPVPGRDMVACGWIPDPALADSDGLLPPELVWGRWTARGTGRVGCWAASGQVRSRRRSRRRCCDRSPRRLRTSRTRGCARSRGASM